MTHKKQAYNLIQEICDINQNQWNNKAGDYDDLEQAAYQIEEALEGFNTLEFIGKKLLDDEMYCDTEPKVISRLIVDAAYSRGLSGWDQIEDVDRFDKHLDSIYFNIGALHQLGLNPQDMIDGLQVVHNANLAKSGKKDNEGKVIKQDNFVNPEPVLQKILDKRSA